MFLSQLWLTNFRNYENVHLTFHEGITLITGNNGNGKTNLLEAIAWFSKTKSFRNTPNESLILQNKEKAILRAEILQNTRKTTLINRTIIIRFNYVANATLSKSIITITSIRRIN